MKLISLNKSMINMQIYNKKCFVYCEMFNTGKRTLREFVNNNCEFTE